MIYPHEWPFISVIVRGRSCLNRLCRSHCYCHTPKHALDFAQCDELSCKFSYVLDAKSVLFLFMLYCTVMLRNHLVHYWTMGSYVEWVSSFFAILFWFKTKVGATAISFISLNDYTTMIFLSEAVGKSEKPILMTVSSDDSSATSTSQCVVSYPDVSSSREAKTIARLKLALELVALGFLTMTVLFIWQITKKRPDATVQVSLKFYKNWRIEYSI